jgi:hypothetical protein
MKMNKAGRAAFGIVLVALILCLGCQAKDYSEMIGPYEVNFTLPDNIASETTLNKTIINNQIAGGFTFDLYLIELQTPGNTNTENNLGIAHYNKTNIKDFEALGSSKLKLKGMTCDFVPQTIDGRDGAIDKCYDRESSNSDYNFMYQLDDRTIVNGKLSLDWDTVVLPFLNSLHIKEAE